MPVADAVAVPRHSLLAKKSAEKLTRPHWYMGVQLQHDLKAGTYLFSLGELGRVLNIPETRLEKAIGAGTIQPLGIVGRNAVVAVTENDIAALVDAFRRHLHGKYFTPEVPTRAPVPEMPAPKPAVIPGTFNL